MSLEFGWGREVFALAIAVQNLIWGAAQPVTGLLADRFGAAKTMIAGTALYVAGLVLMSMSTTPGALYLSVGVLLGGPERDDLRSGARRGGRAVAPERRSRALGIATAIGSFGQFVMLPASLTLIGWLGWSVALIALAGIAASMAALSTALPWREHAGDAHAGMRSGAALREALGHNGFRLLAFGFFVCGFQVVFIITHFPAFLVDRGLSLSVGTNVLALIGLANVAGAYLAGVWGARFRKPALLAAIYAGRALVIAAFLLAADHGGVCVRLRDRDRPAVDEHGAADQRHGGRGLRRPKHGNAEWHRVLRASARRLSRRLARRLSLRPRRELRRRVGDRDRFERARRGGEHTDPRAAGAASPARTSARPVPELALAVALAAVATLAWLGYRRPDFLLWLGNSLFLCT